VIEGDTDKVAYGTGTGGSRSAVIGSGAVVQATDKVIAKTIKIAAHLLEASVEDITFEDGEFVITGTDRSMSFTDASIAAFNMENLPDGMEPGLSELATYTLDAGNFPNGCHVCEVEIDPETGVVEFMQYKIVDDCGVELNPLLVKGQVHGGIAQGAGQALMENIVYDSETGQLLSGSFMDYAMPRADNFCNFDVGSHSVPTKSNILGVKGVGEAGTVGGLAAVMNAVNDALAGLGVEHLEMPATPERVWAAIRDAKGA
jgi:carbon-monoxide dehydrogenase large subunit